MHHFDKNILEIASAYGNIDMINYLIQLCDTTAENNYNLIIKEVSSDGHLNIVKTI